MTSEDIFCCKCLYHPVKFLTVSNRWMDRFGILIVSTDLFVMMCYFGMCQHTVRCVVIGQCQRSVSLG